MRVPRSSKAAPVAIAYGYAVLRTMRAVEALAEGPQRVSHVADKIGVHPKTARRILRRLAADGYVVETPESPARFRADTALRDLGKRLAADPRSPVASGNESAVVARRR